jgi:hypothetical protein
MLQSSELECFGCLSPTSKEAAPPM